MQRSRWMILITVSMMLVACGTSQIVPTGTMSPTLAKPTDTTIPTITPLPPTFTPQPPTLTPTPGIGTTKTGSDGATMLFVPAGEFILGGTGASLDRILETYPGLDWLVTKTKKISTDTEPGRTIYLDGYWIDQTEVTISQYKNCVQSGKCKEVAPQSGHNFDEYMPKYNDPNYENFPVTYVNWEMASTYCSWAGRRLPTEAEWEKAARGSDGNLFPWGNDFPTYEHINNQPLGCEDNPFTMPGFTAPNCVSDLPTGEVVDVGRYPKGASPYGALDMGGNVSEWVADWYSAEYYANSPDSNPQGPDIGKAHVVRGGNYTSVFDDGELFITLRGSQEDGQKFAFWSGRGFRCASDQ